MSSSTDVLAAGNTAWRDYVVDGVPSSGENEARKLEIRAFVASVASAVAGLDGAILDLVAALVAEGATVVATSGDLPAGTDAAVGLVLTGTDAGLWARPAGGSWAPTGLTMAGVVAAQVAANTAAIAALGDLAVLDTLPLAAIAPVHHRRLLGRAGPTDDPTGTGPVYELTPAEGRSVLELGALATLGEVALSNIAAAAQAAFRDRTTHTGTQDPSTIIGLLSALAALTAADTAEATTRAAADTAEATARAIGDARTDPIRSVMVTGTTTKGPPSPTGSGAINGSITTSGIVSYAGGTDVASIGYLEKIEFVPVTTGGVTVIVLETVTVSGVATGLTVTKIIDVPGPFTAGAASAVVAGRDFNSFLVGPTTRIGWVGNPSGGRYIPAVLPVSGFTVGGYLASSVTVGDVIPTASLTATTASARLQAKLTIDTVVDYPSQIAAVSADANSRIQPLEFGQTLTTIGRTSETGAAYSPAGYTYFPGGMTIGANGIKSVSVYTTAGSGYLVFATGSGTSYTPVATYEVTCVAGWNTFVAGTHFPFTKQVGLRIGFYSAAGGAQLWGTTGGTSYARSGAPGTIGVVQTGFASQNLIVSFYATLVATAVDAEATARTVDTQPGWRAEAALLLQQGQTRLGPSALPSGTNDAETATASVHLLGGTNAGARSVVEIQAIVTTLGTGVAEIVVATSSGAPHVQPATIIAAYPLTIPSNGTVTLTAGKNFPAFTKPAGAYLGIRVAAGGPTFRQAYTGGTLFSYTGDPGAAAVVYTGSNGNVNVSFICYPGSTPRNSLLTPWSGRKLVILGDSISANYYFYWLPEFQEITGITTAVNRGINGQVLSGMLDTVVAGDFTDAALCIVGSGVNDWHHGSATIGAWGDAASANTIYGAVRKLIEGIYAQNTNTVPVFWGPFNSGQYTTGPAYGATNPYGLSISNITDAMADACGRFGVPFFATQRRSGVNNLNIAANLPDGLHPSDACGQRFGYALGAFVNGAWPIG